MRLVSAFQGGKVETQVDTTAGGSFSLASSGLANIPPVASPDTMALILDPDGINGAPEIVWVTAHTASAATATFTGAQETTIGRVHYVDEYWVHGWTALDLPSYDTSWIVVGSGGSAPAFTNSWAQYSTIQCKFRKTIAGLVFFQLEATGGTVNTSLWTMPVGYRPNVRVQCLGYAEATGATTLIACGLEVDTTGNMTQSSLQGSVIINNYFACSGAYYADA